MKISKLLKSKKNRRNILKQGAALGLLATLPACGDKSSSEQLPASKEAKGLGNAHPVPPTTTPQASPQPATIQPKQQQAVPTPELFDCLVLGAGIAGITTARDLQEHGYKVLVIEGSNRIGGRIQTLNGVFSGPVDLGAEYVHRDPRDALVWDEINRYRVETTRINKNQDSRLFHPELVTPTKPIGAALKWNAWDAMWMFPKINSYNGRDLSAAQWLDREDYDSLGRDFVGMALTGHMPGFSHDLSIRGFSSDNLSKQLSNKYEYRPIHGYSQLVERMAQPLAIATNQAVAAINYGQGGVTVHCQDGKVFSGRSAVCTFSIGMLKSNSVAILPGLHPLQNEALNHLQAGYHSKVMIEFSHRFWDKDMMMAHHPFSGRLTGRTYFKLFPDRHHNSPLPPMLTALIMGDDAFKTDRMQDEDLIRAICRDLDNMFPPSAPHIRLVNRNLDGSARILRKQWMDDPFSKGGNAYLKVTPGSRMPVESARETLARADLTPGFFLAGEATAIETQPGSVHGAHASGKRAAMQTSHFLRTGRPLSLRYTTKLLTVR